MARLIQTTGEPIFGSLDAVGEPVFASLSGVGEPADPSTFLTDDGYPTDGVLDYRGIPQVPNSGPLIATGHQVFGAAAVIIPTTPVSRALAGFQELRQGISRLLTGKHESFIKPPAAHPRILCLLQNSSDTVNAPNGVYFSDDDGFTFKHWPNSVDPPVATASPDAFATFTDVWFAVTVGASSILVYVSADFGQTWTLRQTIANANNVQSCWLEDGVQFVLYLEPSSGHQRMLRSTDKFLTFTIVDPAPDATHPSLQGIARTGTHTFEMAVSGGSALKSSDDGQTFVFLNNGTISTTAIMAILVPDASPHWIGGAYTVFGGQAHLWKNAAGSYLQDIAWDGSGAAFSQLNASRTPWLSGKQGKRHIFFQDFASGGNNVLLTTDGNTFTDMGSPTGDVPPGQAGAGMFVTVLTDTGTFLGTIAGGPLKGPSRSLDGVAWVESRVNGVLHPGTITGFSVGPAAPNPGASYQEAPKGIKHAMPGFQVMEFRRISHALAGAIESLIRRFQPRSGYQEAEQRLRSLPSQFQEARKRIFKATVAGAEELLRHIVDVVTGNTQAQEATGSCPGESYVQSDTASVCAKAAYCSPSAVGLGVNTIALQAVKNGTPGSANNVVFGVTGATILIQFEIVPVAGAVWKAGDWRIPIDYRAVSVNTNLTRIDICRVSSACANQETIASWAGSILVVGRAIKTYQIVGKAVTPAAGDKVIILLTYTSGGGSGAVHFVANQTICSPILSGLSRVMSGFQVAARRLATAIAGRHEAKGNLKHPFGGAQEHLLTDKQARALWAEARKRLNQARAAYDESLIRRAQPQTGRHEAKSRVLAAVARDSKHEVLRKLRVPLVVPALFQESFRRVSQARAAFDESIARRLRVLAGYHEILKGIRHTLAGGNVAQGGIRHTLAAFHTARAGVTRLRTGFTVSTGRVSLAIAGKQESLFSGINRAFNAFQEAKGQVKRARSGAFESFEHRARTLAGAFESFQHRTRVLSGFQELRRNILFVRAGYQTARRGLIKVLIPWQEAIGVVKRARSGADEARGGIARARAAFQEALKRLASARPGTNEALGRFLKARAGYQEARGAVRHAVTGAFEALRRVRQAMTSGTEEFLGVGFRAFQGAHEAFGRIISAMTHGSKHEALKGLRRAIAGAQERLVALRLVKTGFQESRQGLGIFVRGFQEAVSRGIHHAIMGFQEAGEKTLKRAIAGFQEARNLHLVVMKAGFQEARSRIAQARSGFHEVAGIVKHAMAGYQEAKRRLSVARIGQQEALRHLVHAMSGFHEQIRHAIASARQGFQEVLAQSHIIKARFGAQEAKGYVRAAVTRTGFHEAKARLAGAFGPVQHGYQEARKGLRAATAGMSEALRILRTPRGGFQETLRAVFSALRTGWHEVLGPVIVTQPREIHEVDQHARPLIKKHGDSDIDAHGRPAIKAGKRGSIFDRARRIKPGRKDV